MAGTMHPLLICSIGVMTAVLILDTANRASAQPAPQLKARCSQLISYYDRYGASRGEDSSALRHMTRMAANVDCDHGRYDEGIRSMEDLLKEKKFTIPPPCNTDRPKAAIAQLPGSDGGCN